MKKMLALFLGGSLLIGSFAYAFASESIHKEEDIVIVVDIEDMEEAFEELLIVVEKLELSEEELAELLEEILEELDEEENDPVIAEDKKNKEEVLNKLLQNLYRKLQQYEKVYHRVADPAKPAIQKNIDKIQLKILNYTTEEIQEVLEEVKEDGENLEAKKQVIDIKVKEKRASQKNISSESIEKIRNEDAKNTVVSAKEKNSNGNNRNSNANAKGRKDN
ncbi:hypothetical protein CACET_c03310 [Clostridium aceticum]|uniref:Uncharacterized protein n=1 Tax=Clostridium aceticum TaxID=84022 RepID=A0A0D8I6M4_9CLOT|nr:hypothetical protein [Clostridium aceticum]AKL93847.1 hypothetical protein CACET_c03310 [Clostridium aceticum]KJF25873.1 hypothetical protein TZ02_16930 [Clostridium aceticum]